MSQEFLDRVAELKSQLEVELRAAQELSAGVTAWLEAGEAMKAQVLKFVADTENRLDELYDAVCERLENEHDAADWWKGGE